MNLQLRPVEKEDFKKILEWRNDSEVRGNMLKTGRIAWEEHQQYWDNFLKDGKKFAYILEKEGKDVGIIRLERESEKAEVNIIVAPEFQRRGVGKEALKKIEEKARELKISVLMARIKPENMASIKIFEKNRFELKYHCLEKNIRRTT